MGVETNNSDNMNRQPQQQDQQQQQQQGQNMDQQQPRQQSQVGETSRRIDTDDDGRARDPNDTSPTDNGGGASAQQ
jgi:hypothetical protein